MLTSEYFALDGALTLAVPTKRGQEFYDEETEDGKSLIVWEALVEHQPWFYAIINYEKWEITETNLQNSAEFILKVLKTVQHLSETQFKNTTSYHLATHLQFPKNYGLGSSSTLFNNLSVWANTNPFLLNDLCLGGSGYDIAVAKERSAILFKNTPELFIQKIEYLPDFREQLIFIHLNKKQNSREGIEKYRKKEKSENLINEFSGLTKEVVSCKDLDSFSQLMTIHEQKVSSFLELETVKNQFFKDSPSFVKSLGAWGGDFVMSSKFEGYQEYFSEKGFSTIFDYSELIY